MKVYKVIVKTIGPVHVGSGEKRNKSNYIWDKRRGKVYIPDDKKFMSWIIEKGLIDSFEKYILGKNSDIHFWLKEEGLLDEYKSLMAYSLPTDSIKVGGKVRLNDIHMQIKDSYLQPYIPGSSLKGVIRTALFGEYLYGLKEAKNSNKIKFIDNYLRDRGNPWDRIKKLERASSNLEKEYFNHDQNNEVYSIMKFLSISDSKPISNKNLVLAQKIDTHIDGVDSSRPLFRESIKPGTEIIFEMVLNKDFPFQIKDIEDALYHFYGDVDYCFLSHFDVPERDGDYIYLGGGSGFVTKTNVYQFLEEKKALKTVSKILDDKFRGKDHLKDEKEGVSPRVLKNTIVHGKKLEMGLCSIKFEEIL